MDFSHTLVTPRAVSGIDYEDAFRMERMMRFIGTTVPNTLVQLLLGQACTPGVYNHLTSHWQLAHGGMLVFPESVDHLVEFLLRMHCGTRPVVPSIVVKQRLAHRYQLDASQLDVWIAHGVMSTRDGMDREIELFVVPRSAVPNSVVERERHLENDAHFAFTAKSADETMMRKVERALCDSGIFRFDGGGYNPYENQAAGGTTLMYFARSPENDDDCLLRRIEVQCAGNFEHVLQEAQHG